MQNQNFPQLKIQLQLIKRLKQVMSYYYDKINMYFRLKDQKSHYKRIAEAKKNIDFKQLQHNAISCVRPNHKREIMKNWEIEESNQKLFRRLEEIKKKQGLLQQTENETRRKEYNVEKFASINNSLDQKINRENLKIVQRLSEVRPIVGTRKQWQKQFKRTRSIEKKMHKYIRNDSIDPNEYIRETATSMTKRKTKERKIHTSLTYNHPQEEENLEDLASLQPGRTEKCKKRRSKTRKRIYVEQENGILREKVPINKIILSMGFDYGQSDETKGYTNRKASEHQP